MRNYLIGTFLGTTLLAQTPVPSAVPAIKWRGSIWASGVTQDRHSGDGSVVFRPLESGEDTFTLDGVTLGVDAALGHGWTARVTLLGGRMGKLVNDTSFESGAIAIPEAQLVWTGGNEKFTFGRMNTYIGMEFTDGVQNITASRGLLFTYAAPFTQVGLAWRHTFTSAWSTDVFLFNGEDRVKDNNQGKTLGLGLNYNHGGAVDKFVSLMAYRGAEQDRLDPNRNLVRGVEGRKRDRICVLGQWVWGSSTLLGEFEYGREAFLPAAIDGAVGSGNVHAAWMGVGAIYKYQLNDSWTLFARGEYLKDDMGVRLYGDATINARYGFTENADLKATSFSLGVDRKWGATFARFELRQDRLNRDLAEGGEGNGKIFRDATSATVSIGTSF